jgi:hypothetical protein
MAPRIPAMESPSARLFLSHHPPAEARCTLGSCVAALPNLAHSAPLRTGFGGRADEKIRTARQAAPLSGRKKSHPQHLTVSLIIIVPRMHNSFCTPSLALRAFYERVRCGQKGRKKIAIVAVARKPLSIMRAMQMSGELFSVGVM